MLDQLMVPQPGPTQLKRKRKAENQQRSPSTCKKTIPPRLEQFESYFGHACSVNQHHHNGASGTAVPPNDRHPLISNYRPQEICLPHSGEEPTDSESDFSCLDRVNSYGRTSPSLADSWSNHNQSAVVTGFVTPDDFDVAPFATRRDSHTVSKAAPGTMVGERPSNGVGTTLSMMSCQRDVAADEWGWFVDAGEDDLRAPAVPSTGNVQWGVHRVAQD